MCEQLSRPTVTFGLPTFHSWHRTRTVEANQNRAISPLTWPFLRGEKSSSLPWINYLANTWLGTCNHVLCVHNICGAPVSPMSNPQILQPQKNKLLYNHVHTTTPTTKKKNPPPNQPTTNQPNHEPTNHFYLTKTNQIQ